MPYRDLDLPPTAPPPPALQWAARLVSIQALANIALAGAMRWVESKGLDELSRQAVASERGGDAAASRWLAVMDAPAWSLASWVLVGLVSVASALVVLRGRRGTRWLGVASAVIALSTVVYTAWATGSPYVSGAWLTRKALPPTLLASIPILWAVSRPNARAWVWLASATSFAVTVVPAMYLVRPRSYRPFFDGSFSEGTLAHGDRIYFALSLVTAAIVAVAAFVRRPEDARGPAPDAPMSRSAVAMFLAASIPSTLALVRAALFLHEGPTSLALTQPRSACGPSGSYFASQPRLADFPDLANWFVFAGFVALIATFIAARKLTSTTALLVAAIGALELGYFAVARSGSFWGVFAGVAVVLSTFGVQAAKRRSLDATNALAHGDRKPAADRIARTANALTACSVPAIGAAFVAVAVDLAPVPSKGLAYGAAFLGVAALVLLVLAARVYRRNAWLFSELARVST